MSPNHPIDIFLGMDVDKSEHQACALDRQRKKLFAKPLPQLKSGLATPFDNLQQHGHVLAVVDQPNTIGAFPTAVARARDCQIGCLPGLAMRKAADLYPGHTDKHRRNPN
ncbi:IS110 family transposase [Corynebacterium vitaeruminis]|uniref:IS110 family transposase n=1 Tax=Corynebacterium vitaeruminis TaxID=38305 RepID=UPI0009E430DF